MENRVLPQPKKTPTFSLAPFQTLTPSLPKSHSRPQLCREIVSPNSPMHILPRCWEILQTSRENTLEKTPSKNARHSWFASFGCIRHHTVLKEEAFFSMDGLAAGVGVPGTNLESLHCCCSAAGSGMCLQTNKRRTETS